MKMIKTALLASAAFAVVSTGAQADELSVLKAQIEALNSRVAQMETAPALPAGYSLVSISKGKALQFGLDSDVDAPATVISVMPTADAPSGPTITISGNVKAALVYSQSADGSTLPATATRIAGDSSFDVDSKAGLTIAGVTDTAVGEVGAKMSFEFGIDESTTGNHTLGPDGFWGYWAFADGMKIGGGRDGSLANVGYGIGECACNFTGQETGQGDAGDPSQIRLSYASGPLGFAVAIEDATRANGVAGGPENDDDDAIGFAGEVKYSADMFSFEVAGGVWGDDDLVASPNRKHQFGAGVGMTFDPITLHVAVSMGKNHDGSKFTDYSTLLKANLAEGISAELGFGHISRSGPANNTNDIVAGIYYSPVSQLTIGVEADYEDDQHLITNNDGLTAAFVTKYAF